MLLGALLCVVVVACVPPISNRQKKGIVTNSYGIEYAQKGCWWHRLSNSYVLFQRTTFFALSAVADGLNGQDMRSAIAGVKETPSTANDPIIKTDASHCSAAQAILERFPSAIEFAETLPLFSMTWRPQLSDHVPFVGRFKMSCTWGGATLNGHCVVGQWNPYHPYPALDIQLPDNSPVLASGRGTVTQFGLNDPSFGNWVLIYHRDDDRTSMYAHLTSINPAIIAEFHGGPWIEVTLGYEVGRSGHTGNTQGAHLHYAEAKGVVTSPIWTNGVDPGPIRALASGQPVTYPQKWGFNDWTRTNIDPKFGNPYLVIADGIA
jgi:hypothetical protein